MAEMSSKEYYQMLEMLRQIPCLCVSPDWSSDFILKRQKSLGPYRRQFLRVSRGGFLPYFAGSQVPTSMECWAHQLTEEEKQDLAPYMDRLIHLADTYTWGGQPRDPATKPMPRILRPDVLSAAAMTTAEKDRISEVILEVHRGFLERSQSLGVSADEERKLFQEFTAFLEGFCRGHCSRLLCRAIEVGLVGDCEVRVGQRFAYEVGVYPRRIITGEITEVFALKEQQMLRARLDCGEEKTFLLSRLPQMKFRLL